MLVEPLFEHARRQPSEIAIIDDRGNVPYSQLGAMAAGLGMYLGMQTQSPRVGLLLPASAAFVASFYGTLLAGKTVVPINFLLGDREIAHIIRDSGIDTVVSAPAGRQIEGSAAQCDRSDTTPLAAAGDAAEHPGSLRRRHRRAHVYQRHQWAAEGRAPELWKLAKRRRCGHRCRPAQTSAQVPRRNPAVSLFRDDRDDARPAATGHDDHLPGPFQSRRRHAGAATAQRRR